MENKKYFKTRKDAVKYCANNEIPESAIYRAVVGWLNGEADVLVFVVKQG